MLTLTQAEEGREYTVKDVKGDARFISRITSIGLTTGAMLKVVRNVKRLPFFCLSRLIKAARSSPSCAFSYAFCFNAAVSSSLRGTKASVPDLKDAASRANSSLSEKIILL